MTEKHPPNRDPRPGSGDQTDTPPMTPSTGKKNPADKPLGKPGKNSEHRLDEGLEETFPASDPVSTHIE